MILGAVLLGALGLSGLAGSNGGLWWSDAVPHAGTDYVAISWTGPGEFQCGGSIGRTPVTTTVYRFDETTICVLRIPRGSAGKMLQVGHAITFREGNLVTIADGAPMKPKLIRR